MQYLRSYLAEQFCQDCTWQSRYDLFRTQSNPDDTVAILLIRIARSCACKKDYPIFPGLFLRPLFFRGRVIKILRNKKKKRKKKGKHLVKAAGVRFTKLARESGHPTVGSAAKGV